MFTALYQGRERLFLFDAAGYGLLYEEDDDDCLPILYLDLVVTGTVNVGDTVQVNGGTLITAIAGNNDATHWGDSSLTGYGGSFWHEEPGSGGFDQAKAIHWTAPNTLPIWIQSTANSQWAMGVRFYSTTGVMPAVALTGSGITVTYYKRRPIVSTFISRAYAAPAASRQLTTSLAINWQTSDPTIYLSVLTPGVYEEFVLLTGKIMDRSKYYSPYNRADYVLSGVNGDTNVPYRQDYSFCFGSASGQSADLYLDQSAGVALDLLQESRYRRRLSIIEDRAAQVRIVNSTGRIRIMDITLEVDEFNQRDGFTA